MDELEELKRKKLEQLQSQHSQVEEQVQLQQQIEQLEAVVKRLFTKDALQRFGNVKAAHPEKAVQVLVVLGQLMQQNKIAEINDEQLKEILQQITPQKRDFKINKV